MVSPVEARRLGPSLGAGFWITEIEKAGTVKPRGTLY
jgi:hypothetical protein